MSSLFNREFKKPSARELEIFSLIEQGLNNVEIGQNLYISPETVKSHVGQVLRKTLARNRAQALALLIRNEWL